MDSAGTLALEVGREEGPCAHPWGCLLKGCLCTRLLVTCVGVMVTTGLRHQPGYGEKPRRGRREPTGALHTVLAPTFSYSSAPAAHLLCGKNGALRRSLSPRVAQVMGLGRQGQASAESRPGKYGTCGPSALARLVTASQAGTARALPACHPQSLAPAKPHDHHYNWLP